MTDTTRIDDLPTTSSGCVRKQDTLRWLEDLETPSEDELIAAVTPQPTDHSGSKYATEISSIRITGAPDFVETVAALLQPLLAWESSATRLAVNLQETEDRDSGDLTGNYALYLSAAVRGKQGAMSRALLGDHRDEDQKLANALDKHGGDT
jgi:hypothetical protein